MDTVKKVADPAGITSGTSTTQSLIDPVGAGIKSITGSDIAQRAADPIGLFKPPDVPPPSAESQALQNKETALISSQKSAEEARLKTEKADIDKKKSLMNRGGTGRSLLIKTTPRGVTERATTLGG